jgi:gamma-glutamyltranspeptidase/glutathione hydrolase
LRRHASLTKVGDNSKELEEPVMKNSVSVSLYFLVSLALLLQGAPAGNTFAQLRQSGAINLSPEAWPQGELEKYWQLQKDYNQRQPAVEGSHGMVAVTSDAFAARVGMEALQQGGSAADAVLAAALAQVALKGGATISYAGILTMVYYDAASKQAYSLNAGYNTVKEEKDPLTIPGMGKPSGRSALVPGFFAGVQAAHDRFGKLSFTSLFEPAIYLAEKGFIVDRVLDYYIDSQKSVLTRLPETKRIFTKVAGELYRTGDLFKQPQLAETLRKVAAQRADYIYQGEWAKKFVTAVQSEGGKITLTDLKAYRPIWSEPAHTTYHGYQVYALGQPSLGGVKMIEALNLLEMADLKRHGHYTTSPEALYEFIRICRAGYLLSYWPEIVKMHVPEVDLSFKSRVKKESARLLWRKMNEPAWQKVISAARPKSGGANHSAGVVAVDARGNVAAILHSINGIFWGSTGIFVDGISIPDSASVNRVQIAKLKPGDRLPEPTFPLIALKNEKPYLASSSIGGIGTHAMTINNLVNVLDFGMDLKKSIDTPNFMGPILGGDQWDKEALPEGAFAENLVQAVVAKGQAIKLLSKMELLAQRGYWVAIQIDTKTGKRVGVAPLGANGCVAGY